jgi:hypothetical protein
MHKNNTLRTSKIFRLSGNLEKSARFATADCENGLFFCEYSQKIFAISADFGLKAFSAAAFSPENDENVRKNTENGRENDEIDGKTPENDEKTPENGSKPLKIGEKTSEHGENGEISADFSVSVREISGLEGEIWAVFAEKKRGDGILAVVGNGTRCVFGSF